MSNQFDFDPPAPLRTAEFHLEPLGVEHNERDYEAWTSSMEHIRATPGFAHHPWPHPMTLAENRSDIAMHAQEFIDRAGYTYSILDGEQVIGCVYINPPKEPVEGDAKLRSWVRASRAESDAPIRAALRAWLLGPDWPFETISYPSGP
ncbi:MAG: N-acetyltransferase [Acidimicrobiales bacterium]|nr:N-acetyltransferase [Acidimicrobiales bacterium]